MPKRAPIPQRTPEELSAAKLNNEVTKLERENSRWASWWTRVTPVLAVSTTLTAVIGLVLNNYFSRHDANLKEFNDALGRLSADKPEVQRNAINALGRFWSDNGLQTRLRTAFIDQIVAERDEDVRASLRSALINASSVDSQLLTLLARQNRDLQGALRRHHIDGAWAALMVPNGDRYENGLAGDSALARAANTLGANIRTLIAAINKMRTIPAVDFHGVTFSRPYWRAQMPVKLYAADDSSFATGLHFVKTDLRGANLIMVTFASAEFDDANLDGVHVAGATFDSTLFRNSHLDGWNTDVRTFQPSAGDLSDVTHQTQESVPVTVRGGLVSGCGLTIDAMGSATLVDVQIDLAGRKKGADSVTDQCPPPRPGQLSAPEGKHVSTRLSDASLALRKLPSKPSQEARK